MKGIITLALVAALVSCNSNSSNGSSADSTVDVKPVQNVNGNIPDTSNAGPITGSKRDSVKVDSTYADTAKRK